MPGGRGAAHSRLRKLDFDRRDKIEQAALHVQTVSDTAYFYAGLMFGLAFSDVRDR